MPNPTRQAVIARLRQLAAGAMPHDSAKLCGICTDVSYVVDGDKAEDIPAFRMCSDAVAELGYGRGFVYRVGDWGPQRRELAAKIAAHLQDQEDADNE